MAYLLVWVTSPANRARSRRTSSDRGDPDPALRRAASSSGSRSFARDDAAARRRRFDGPDRMDDHHEILRRLSIRDEKLVSSILAHDRENVEASGLDIRTHALVRIGALIAIDAAAPSYMWTVDAARASGATDQQIVGALIAVMPAIGSGRVVSAAPKLGLALGYDVGEALEALENADPGL
jgi:4-carboxymuconolactone decarboxylase